MIASIMSAVNGLGKAVGGLGKIANNVTKIFQTKQDVVLVKNKGLFGSVITTIFILILATLPALLLFLLAYNILPPVSTTAYMDLIDYLKVIVMLTLGGGGGILGVNKYKNNQIKNQQIQTELKEAKAKNEAEALSNEQKAKAHNTTQAIIPQEKTVIKLVRDYKKDYTLSRVYLKSPNETEYKELEDVRMFELPQKHEGVINAVRKTCILEGVYDCYYAKKSASGKFGKTGIMVVKNTPGRSSILVHYGGSLKHPSKYSNGCLLPFNKIKSHRIYGSLPATEELFKEITQEELDKGILLQIVS